MIKKEYKSPKLEEVNLVAEEAVLQNCKSFLGTGTTGPGGFNGGCALPPISDFCFSWGS
jgi:hypothetical protein